MFKDKIVCSDGCGDTNKCLTDGCYHIYDGVSGYCHSCEIQRMHAKNNPSDPGGPEIETDKDNVSTTISNKTVETGSLKCGFCEAVIEKNKKAQAVETAKHLRALMGQYSNVVDKSKALCSKCFLAIIADLSDLIWIRKDTNKRKKYAEVGLIVNYGEPESAIKCFECRFHIDKQHGSFVMDYNQVIKFVCDGCL